jgi:KaiC/GvpD/RAD55 family RecA-like ATPase
MPKVPQNKNAPKNTREVPDNDLPKKGHRVATGIKGFDELVEGGFPAGSTVLLTGTPGTGKTIFGLEYIYNGITKFNERGLYVSFEQPVRAIIEQARRFGWDLEPLIENDSLAIEYIPVSHLTPNTADLIIQKLAKEKRRRLVIDSLSTLAINAPIYTAVKDVSLVDIMEEKAFFSPPIMGDYIVKRFIYKFVDSLRVMDHICTSMLISESSEKGEYLSRDTVSEFVADGVILVTFDPMGGEYSRNLIVRKMRNTKNDEDIHPLEISDKGMIVHNIK